MFLVFFVMALALLAQTTRFESEGEKFILDDVIAESNELFIRMGQESYEKAQDGTEEARPVLATRLLAAYAAYQEKVGAEENLPCAFITEQYAGDAADDEDTLRLAAEDYHVAARFIAWQMLHRELQHDRMLCTQLELSPEADDEEVTEKLKGFFRRVRDDDVLRHVNACLQTAGIGIRVDSADELIGHLSAENNRLATENKRLQGSAAIIRNLTEEKSSLEESNKRLSTEKKDAVGKVKQLSEENDSLRETNKQLQQDKDGSAAHVQQLTAEQRVLEEKVSALKVEMDETKQKLVAKDAREQHVVLDETRVRFIQNETRFAEENTARAALDTATQQLIDCLAKNLAFSSAFAIEIIGHTDTTPNGAVNTAARYRAAMKADESNPKLGLLRADKVMTEIRARMLRERQDGLQFLPMDEREDSLRCVFQTEYGNTMSVPVSFRCYSGSWLTPLHEGAYEEHASNRRVEMFIRPVSKEKNAE